jgi:D-glycero-D-manno-heptose 1,7-bisphosphate phosphatase
VLDGLHREGEMLGIFARWYMDDPRSFAHRQALFIDRDGVLIEEANYLYSPVQVSLMAGISAAIKKLNLNNIPVIIVTNQAGIGRGYYGWEDFIKVQDYIYETLQQEGARIDACVACPYHPEAKEPYRHDAHYFRKPEPGMILWAAKTAELDLGRSWIAGDKLTDLQSGEKAGLHGLAHVVTGYGLSDQAIVREWAKDKPGFKSFRNLCEVIDSFLAVNNSNSLNCARKG